MSNTTFKLTQGEISKLRNSAEYRDCTLTVLYPGGLCRVYQNSYHGLHEITHLLLSDILPGLYRESEKDAIFVSFMGWLSMFGEIDHALDKMEIFDVEQLGGALLVLCTKNIKDALNDRTEVPARLH